jgi:signal transduction histidine kinase/CheY-like chemotaxis protein/HPt (histidine-containing phosphotransfer) domain-containing protein
MGLRARLLVFIALVALPLLALVLYVTISSGVRARDDARRLVEQLSRAVVNEEQDVVDQARHLMVALAEIPIVQDRRVDCAALFARLLGEYKIYTTLGVTSENGAVRCSAPAGLPGTTLADRPIFQRLLRAKPVFIVGEYTIGRLSGKPSLGLLYPVVNGRGELTGTVFGALDLAWLPRLLAEATLAPGTTVTLIDRNGVVFARLPDAGGWVGKNVRDTALARTLGARVRATDTVNDLDGRERLFAFAHLSSAPDAIVAVGIDRRAFLGAVYRELFGIATLIFAFAVVVLAVIWFGADALLLRPLRRVIATTRRFADGDLGSRVGVTGGGGELADLGQAFDHMAETVAHRTREVERARASAEAATRVKSEFLANMSHELRTPLNGIIGMTELALGTTLTFEQQEYLDTVQISADSLLGLINDILDFSKIEAGKLDLERVDFDVRYALDETMRPLAPRAHQKGLELAYHVEDGVPAVVSGDPARLRQIVVNLIGNAVKFTEVGEVVLRVAREGPAGAASSEATAVTLRFSVSDTGVGIPEEKQATIFDSFTQADASTTRRFGGTGLGLAIASQLVSLMGGRIWVESQPGHGSRFHVTIPFGVPSVPPAQAPQSERPELEGMPVLVVDDNATNRRILDEILTSWGMRATVVDSGAAGLAAMERARQSGQPFPLVLLDYQMPDMDGFEVAERIAQRPDRSGATIVMLSSIGQRGDAQRCRELGVAAYISKPVRQSVLQDTILAVVARPASGPEARTLVTRHSLREAQGPARGTPPKDNAADPLLMDGPAGGEPGLVPPPSAVPLRPLRVVVAEDNRVNQLVIRRLLERLGHAVVLCDDGRSAIAAIETERPDIVLMDVQMPEMDGFAATAAIREREAARSSDSRLPIVALTAHAMKGDRERCLAAGMDDYLTKPIRPAELAAVLARFADEVRRPAEADELGPALDEAAALAYAGDDRRLLGELLGVFLEDSPGHLQAIRVAVAGANPAALMRAAQTMNDSLQVLGAAPATALVALLEALGREGRLDGAAALLARLEPELERVRGAAVGAIASGTQT